MTQTNDTSASDESAETRPGAALRLGRVVLRTLWLWLLLTAAAFSAAAAAEAPLLWYFTKPDASWPAAPDHALALYAIRMDASVLATLQPGQRVRVEVDGPQAARQLIVEIGSETPLINGDRSFSADLLDDLRQPLVMTVGQEAAFAHLETATTVWQLQVSRSDDGDFTGWVYESPALDSPRQNDYVIPLQAPGKPVSRQPLLIAPARVGTLHSAATNSGIHGGNIEIRQQAPEGVIAGSQVTVSVDFRNTVSENHRGLIADIYFVLENSTLITASPGCASGVVSGQPVLRCSLGDLAPGATRRVSYTVQTSEASRPYLTSTAIIGNARQDTFVNVVRDVTHDTDSDGISDFNEGLLGSDPANPASVNRAKSVLDVMVLYTPDAQSQYNGHAETRINQLISVANQDFADSGVDIILRPVLHRQVDYPQMDDMDTMLDRLTRNVGIFSEVPGWRETYGADLVMLFRPQRAERDRCGLANLGGNDTLGDFSSERDYAYSLMAIDCPVSAVVAHEVGHNLGLTHSHREDGFGGTFPYATGYGVDGRFTTVMAFPGAFNTSTRIGRFSSPQLDCSGEPCGIDHRHETEGADAVRTLNTVRHQVAAYLPARVPELPARSVMSSSGGATDARIASAASTNEGLSFVQRASQGQMLDLIASVQVDSRHTGLEGIFHVLVGLGSGEFFTLTEQGAIEPWNGRVEGLRSFMPGTAPLRVIENLRLVTGLRIDPAYVGTQLRIYVAYQVVESGELIFTPDPLVIDIVP